MNLVNFILFNPQTDSGSKIPERPGNNIVTIRDINALPTLGYKIVTHPFEDGTVIRSPIAHAIDREGA